jgi:hypothetical protein
MKYKPGFSKKMLALIFLFLKKNADVFLRPFCFFGATFVNLVSKIAIFFSNITESVELYMDPEKCLYLYWYFLQFAYQGCQVCYLLTLCI